MVKVRGSKLNVSEYDFKNGLIFSQRVWIAEHGYVDRSWMSLVFSQRETGIPWYIKQAAKVKLFETIQPLKAENTNLKRQIDTISGEYAEVSQQSQG